MPKYSARPPHTPETTRSERERRRWRGGGGVGEVGEVDSMPGRVPRRGRAAYWGFPLGAKHGDRDLRRRAAPGVAVRGREVQVGAARPAQRAQPGRGEPEA